MHPLIGFIEAELQQQADPEKAAPMAAYLKTDMPFYGVQTPARRAILRRGLQRFPIADVGEYEQTILSMWGRPHREEKYMAIGIAHAYPQYVSMDRLDLFRRLIVEGAWWDLVDSVASGLIGKLVLDHRTGMRPVLDRWIEDDDLWLRRTAIICQLDHKESTDAGMLFAYCLARAHEKEFFIRKAIGWALRQYARTDPEAVGEFLLANREQLSGLSYREASKHLVLGT